MAPIVFIRLRFRIDPRRSYHPYRIDNVIRPQTPSDDYGNMHVLYDFPVDLPAVGYAERAYLHVAGSMTV
jgi:hypothetical protein